MRVEVKIKGITPYMQHRFPIEDMREILDKVKIKVIKTKTPPVIKALYKEGDKIYLPAAHLEGAIKEASKNFKGRGRSSLYKVLCGILSVEPEKIFNFKPQKWVIDERVGNNPNTGKGGNKVIIERPKFEDWEAEFVIRVDTSDISSEKLREVVEFAGNYVGIGSYRPSKGGKFGRFKIVKWEVLEK